LGLLSRDPIERLGSQTDGGEIKDHPFFDGIDWAKLADKKLPAPFVPTITDFTDTTNFDVEFTDMPLFSVSSTGGPGSLLSGSPDSKFAGFTYINPSSAPETMAMAEPTEQHFEGGLDADQDIAEGNRQLQQHLTNESHSSTSTTSLTPSAPPPHTVSSSSSSTSSTSSNTSPGTANKSTGKGLLGALLGALTDKKPTNGTK